MAAQFKFGPFHLDERERRLTRRGAPVRLEPKAFDLLCHLLRHAGHLVGKQELVEAVWPGLVVTDNSVTRCVHQVRAALGDHVDSPSYVETVPGAGYRFIAPVEEVVGESSGGGPLPRRAAHWLVVALLTGVILAGLLWTGYHTLSRPDAPIERLAVLPLVNLTGNPEQEYFVQGIHEALVSELSRLDIADVISRTSVMRYAETSQSIPEIARELDVDALVEGSVLREGEVLTVIAQLVAGEPERHLWSDRFDRSIGDVFEITHEIAKSIAGKIATEPEPAALAIPARSVDPEAYDAYLQGRFKFQTITRSDYQKAQHQFRRAIEIDPEFAPAYAGLAHTLASAAIFGMLKPADSMPRTRTLAEQAIAIDPTLEDAHILLAGVTFYWDWDWAEAESRLRRVLELNPNSAHAYRILAEVLSVAGHHEAALAAINRGRDLDPMSPVSQLKPSLILHLKRDYRQAAEIARARLNQFEGFWPGHWLLCRALTALGEHKEAIAACKKAAAHSRQAPLALGSLGYAYARDGRAGDAERVLAELEALRANRYVGAASFAIIHGALGHHDKAFQELERAYEERDVSLRHAENAGEFDLLRSDPRFRSLRVEALAAK